MTTVELQQQDSLLRKFSIEVRPPPLSRRDIRIRSMTRSFEEIVESEEEEDTQIYERPQPQGRSLFAVQLPSPYARGRRNPAQNFNSVYVRKVVRPRLCRGISDPELRRGSPSISMRCSMSLDNHGGDLLTLPPIPESVGSSSS